MSQRVGIYGTEIKNYFYEKDQVWVDDIRIEKIISAPISATNFSGGFSSTIC